MNKKNNPTPLWENLIGLAGLLLLCAGFIYLTWTKITDDKSPSTVLFSVSDVAQSGTDFVVSVKVKNEGFQSLASLQVEAVVSGEDLQEERNNLEVDYLPSNSTREIGFYFRQNPALGKLEFRALGYQVP